MNPNSLVTQLQTALGRKPDKMRENAMLAIKYQMEFFINNNKALLENLSSKKDPTSQEKQIFYATTQTLVAVIEQFLPKLKPTIAGKIYNFFFGKSENSSDKKQDHALYHDLGNFLKTLKKEKLFLQTEEEFIKVSTMP